MQSFVPRDAFALKTQRELSHPKFARKVHSSSFFTACIAYGVDFPFLLSIRVIIILNIPLCLPDGIYDFLLPPENYQRQSQQTQSIGTVLTRGAIGKILLREFSVFRRRKKKKEKSSAFLDWIAIYGNPVKEKTQRIL